MVINIPQLNCHLDMYKTIPLMLKLSIQMQTIHDNIVGKL